MEVVLSIFLGIWICTAGVLSYHWLKKELFGYIKPDNFDDKKDNN